MPTPDKPKPDATKQQPETLEAEFERIEPLKIKAVNGFRARIKKLLKKWGLILGLSVAVGGVAGHGAQEYYRSKTGYNPNKPAAAETVPKPEESAKEDSGDKEAKGWLRKAQEAYRGAKEWTGKKAEETKIARKYREAKEGMKSTYQGILKFGDKATFWTAFILFFLASTMLASKLADIKKSLTETVDPDVAKNMDAIVAHLNTLTTRVNKIGERLNKGERGDQKEAKALMDELEDTTKGLGGDETRGI